MQEHYTHARLLYLALSHTQTHTHTHINTYKHQPLWRFVPHLYLKALSNLAPVSPWFIIIPFFQSFNLKICSSSFLITHKQERHVPGRLCGRLWRLVLITSEEPDLIRKKPPVFSTRSRTTSPLCWFLALSEGMILMNMIWKRGRERGIRWKDYNFQWREIIRNNKS